MTLTNEAPPFADWVGPALLFFFQAAGLLCLIALVLAYLVSAFRYGPLTGGDVVYRMLRTAASDFFSISPRRIFALARLAAQEALRRRVLVGFAVFVLILLFAGWFLDTQSSSPAPLYLSFVLTATTYLVLLMALFLSAFSLPADIKNHTIYTVVTKPVRPGEIVLGRILGFAMIGTVLLGIMGAISYVFVIRVLDHAHEIEIASLQPVANDSTDERTGRTSLSQNHRHTVQIDAQGRGSTDRVQGHWHLVDPVTQGDQTSYVLSAPQGLFVARVPQYGQLRFKDRAGKGGDRGISVGHESKYRSFVEGGTLAAAIWTFDDVTPARFPDELPLEVTIRVFRSYKGDIERGIKGGIFLRNPRTGRSSAMKFFEAKDMLVDEQHIGRKLLDEKGSPLDLFDDLVADGQVEIWLQCLDESQYFGVARADLYLRAADASFTVNFLKSYLGIWVQMLLVTSFGVMFSTFLSGAVAMMATLASLVLGFFTTFVFDVARGAIQGGGPIESLIRILKQQNVMMEMEPGLTKTVVQGADGAFMRLMTAMASVLPDFRSFSNVDYLSHGFDIPPNLVCEQVFSTLGYMAAVFVIGYVFLRTREVAR